MRPAALLSSASMTLRNRVMGPHRAVEHRPRQSPLGPPLSSGIQRPSPPGHSIHMTGCTAERAGEHRQPVNRKISRSVDAILASAERGIGLGTGRTTIAEGRIDRSGLRIVLDPSDADGRHSADGEKGTTRSRCDCCCTEQSSQRSPRGDSGAGIHRSFIFVESKRETFFVQPSPLCGRSSRDS
jgi:hypothetical protein